MRVAAPANVAATLAKAGLDHIAQQDPSPEAAKPVLARLDAAVGEAAFPFAIQQLFYGIRAAASLPGVLTAAHAWRPDLILREA